MLTAASLPEGGALLQLQDGSIVEVIHDVGQRALSLSPVTGFPEPCPDMCATPAAAHGSLGMTFP